MVDNLGKIQICKRALILFSIMKTQILFVWLHQFINFI